MPNQGFNAGALRQGPRPSHRHFFCCGSGQIALVKVSNTVLPLPNRFSHVHVCSSRRPSQMRPLMAWSPGGDELIGWNSISMKKDQGLSS